jgi:RNA polymerase sigma-70 factor, ECF subfamily
MKSYDPAGQSDALLVLAVARWREDALAEIYQRHAGAVYALSCRLLVDRTKAEDVTQEIFLKLWNDPTGFDPERGSLRSYLLMQAHSRSVDLMRSETSRRTRETNDASHIDQLINSLEREVVDLTVAEEVKAAFRSLPDAEREPIDLAYFKGHTYREVAQLLGQPEGTIKSRIRSGLRRMKESLPTGAGER